MKNFKLFIQEALVKKNTTHVANSDDIEICKHKKYGNCSVLIGDDEQLNLFFDIFREKNEQEYSKLKYSVERYFLNVKDRSFKNYFIVFEIDETFDKQGKIASWDFVDKHQFIKEYNILGELDIYDISWKLIKDRYETN